MIEEILAVSDKYIVPELKASVSPHTLRASGALRAAAFFLALAARPDLQNRVYNGVGFDVYIRGSGFTIKEKVYRRLRNNDERGKVSGNGLSVQ